MPELPHSYRTDPLVRAMVRRVDRALADLDHVRANRATTHHDACWDEHIGCLAARIRRTLTGEDADHG